MKFFVEDIITLDLLEQVLCPWCEPEKDWISRDMRPPCFAFWQVVLSFCICVCLLGWPEKDIIIRLASHVCI